MDDRRKSKPLYIPVNVPDADDFIAGIGKFELTIIMSVLAVALLVTVPLGYATGNTFMFSVICFLVVFAVILIVRRDSHNENIIKKIKVVLDYIKSQKKYIYSYVNIYETIPDNTEEYYDEE